VSNGAIDLSKRKADSGEASKPASTSASPVSLTKSEISHGSRGVDSARLKAVKP